MATRAHDILTAVCGELQKAHIKPVLKRSRKHIKVVWDAGTKPQQFIVPSTPSDHRSLMNARAEVRRMLKETAHLLPAPPAAPTKARVKLDKAMGLPAHAETINDRLGRIEEALLILPQITEALADLTELLLVVTGKPEPITEEAVKETVADAVWKALSFTNPLTAEEVAKVVGVSRAHAATTLGTLVKAGRVKRLLRGQYVRMPLTVEFKKAAM